MALSRKGWIFAAFGALAVAAAIAVTVYFTVFYGNNEESDERPTWGYKCEKSTCKRVEFLSQSDTPSFYVCRMTCGEDIGTLWPVPNGKVEFDRKIIAIDLNTTIFETNSALFGSQYWNEAWLRFREMQLKKILNHQKLFKGFPILLNVHADSTDMTLNYDTYEGYSLKITSETDKIKVDITAANFYGIRHALETLSQLIVYDDFSDSLVILSRVKIEDEPEFPHRGISFDTSRNFYPISAIKRTINGLAMVKLNTFHWHLTDAHSFPFAVKSRPDLSRLGAYSADKVYTAADIKEVVEFGKSRGVRVVPEFDAPAHVGEGWQNTDLVMCYKDPSMQAQWRGHFDPTKDELYDILEDVYREIVDAFQPNIFHIGADEVDIRCWNSSESVKEWMNNHGLELTKDGFMDVWNHFQTNALQRLDKSLNKSAPVIMWSSSLTEVPYLTKFLDKNRHIIQVWLDATDIVNLAKINQLLQNGFKIILSNSDALYLDCGVGSFVGDSLNWCEPYKTWQRVYSNKIENIVGAAFVDQVYGAEVAIWSESIDSSIVDLRIWPRASALAERLWSNPQAHWRKAEPRLLINRDLLVKVGELAAERLQPEWCLLKEGECPED